MDQRYFLSVIFLLSGTFNVLVVKWANEHQFIGSDGKHHRFQHPVVFTLLMFLGEFLCFGIIKVIRMISRVRDTITDLDSSSEDSDIAEFCPLTMILPTLLDAVASILLFSGLHLTYASSFQMIRGSATIFTGIFSSMFLNHPLICRHWLAISTISLALVGIIYADIQSVRDDNNTLPCKDYKSILTCDLLIIIAEILHGLQYVCEEKQLKTSNVTPLQAAGWQGIFGLVITSLLAIGMHFLPSIRPFNDSSRGVFDDWSDLYSALKGNPYLILALIGFTISCAPYNSIGLFITMDSTSTNRLLVDAVRILFIWMFVWNKDYVNLAMIIGFVVLIMGIKLYSRPLFLDWYQAAMAFRRRFYYEDLTAEDAVAPDSRPEPEETES
ncbi:solute carrier family 35 member F6-like [Drosophila elegans]|uniref:solute carrier family 35 member F6-like n=1 Tax=Drosophila elegans TaxID=30023 RepID=UPI0007E685A0|nr:solute carrier family 35 member F6-like [Drosophila elegans]